MLDLELPVVQAGMGSIPTGRLAAAVSEAGGLGTVSWLPPRAMRAELALARSLTSRRIAANVIVPLARREHWRIAAEADVVVTHWETAPVRRVDKPWLHTVGSTHEARAAVEAGADGVVAQGVEAGGHVRGRRPALELLAEVRGVVPSGFPVLLAGGVAERADVEQALAAGATAAVAGTRFLASAECPIHPAYQRRIVEGSDTVLTELFGLGWAHAPHRVLLNDATRRWLREDPAGPRWVRGLHAAASPLAARAPSALQARLAHRAGTGLLSLTPQLPLAGMPAHTVEASALYAGTTVARISDVRPAARIVADMAP